MESDTKTVKVVKSYHNIDGLPGDLTFGLVEPLRQLSKDEVHVYGLELGLPHDMVFRQSLPGPGLGVHRLGATTKDRLETVCKPDATLCEEFTAASLDQKIW